MLGIKRPGRGAILPRLRKREYVLPFPCITKSCAGTTFGDISLLYPWQLWSRCHFSSERLSLALLKLIIRQMDSIQKTPYYLNFNNFYVFILWLKISWATVLQLVKGFPGLWWIQKFIAVLRPDSHCNSGRLTWFQSTNKFTWNFCITVRNWVVLHGLQMKLHFCGSLSDETAEANKCLFLLKMALIFYQRKMYI